MRSGTRSSIRDKRAGLQISPHESRPHGSIEPLSRPCRATQNGRSATASQGSVQPSAAHGSPCAAEVFSLAAESVQSCRRGCSILPLRVFNLAVEGVQSCRRGCSISAASLFNLSTSTVPFKTGRLFNAGTLFKHKRKDSERIRSPSFSLCGEPFECVDFDAPPPRSHPFVSLTFSGKLCIIKLRKRAGLLWMAWRGETLLCERKVSYEDSIYRCCARGDRQLHAA